MKLVVGMFIIYWLMLVFTVSQMITACGDEVRIIEYPSPSKPDKPPTPDPGDSIPTWGEVKTILGNNCAKCHAGAKFLNTGVNFMNSSAPTRILNNTMPPPGTEDFNNFNQGDRDIVLRYMDSKK